MGKLRLYLKSLRFATPNALVAAVSAAALTETISHLDLALPGDVNTTVLLPLKAGLAGVLAAAVLAFWGFFWNEVLAPSTKRGDFPAQVKVYRRWFAWLVPALLLLFVSMGADFYLVLVNKQSPGATAISFSTFGGAMLMIGLFVLAFTFRTAVDMSNLLAAGQIPKNTAVDAKRHEAVKAAFLVAGYAGPLTVAANMTVDEHVFVLQEIAFNKISDRTSLTQVLQQLLGTKVSIVEESSYRPTLTPFE
jgi:hypothetical protein